MDVLWQAVLASAAVGAVASQVVSLVGQGLERKARRDELLLRESIHLSLERTKTLMEVTEKAGKSVGLWDNMIMAATYYRWLRYLFASGLQGTANPGCYPK